MSVESIFDGLQNSLCLTGNNLRTNVIEQDMEGSDSKGVLWKLPWLQYHLDTLWQKIRLLTNWWFDMKLLTLSFMMAILWKMREEFGSFLLLFDGLLRQGYSRMKIYQSIILNPLHKHCLKGRQKCNIFLCIYTDLQALCKVVSLILHDSI